MVFRSTPFQAFWYQKLCRLCGALHNHHTNASSMLQYNVPAKVTAQRVGRSSNGITLDLYSHVIGDVQTEAANKIEIGVYKKLAGESK